MKKFTLVLVLAVTATVIWGCKLNMGGSNQASQQEKKTVNLYFTNKDNSKILSESRTLAIKSGDSLERVVINELVKGPVSPDLKKAIPEGTQLLDMKLENSIATVDFSKEYYNTSANADIIVASFSVVNSLCELPGIKKVNILVENKALVGPSGNPFGTLGKEDAVFGALPNEKGQMEITLYFGASTGDMLTPEVRNIPIKEKEPIEKYIIQELIKGPKDKANSKTVPPETKLLSIETKEGTCFVNLSEDFKTKHWGGSTGEMLTIYSIVDSLTELPDIQKVQFLIEGQKLDVFEHMVFNEPFSRDESLIKN